MLYVFSDRYARATADCIIVDDDTAVATDKDGGIVGLVSGDRKDRYLLLTATGISSCLIVTASRSYWFGTHAGNGVLLQPWRSRHASPSWVNSPTCYYQAYLTRQ